MRRDARITILTSSGDGIITSVHTDPATGKYELVLQPGQSYMIVVEGGGYLPHAEIFDLPSGIIDPELKQVVEINKDDQKEELTLKNYFGSGSSEPTKSITRSYSSKIDSSSMISVKINDQIIYVTPPSVSNDENSVDTKSNLEDKGSDTGQTINGSLVKTPNDSDALPEIKIKQRDKYDPTLEQGISADQIQQQKEEAERIKDIQEDEKSSEKSYDFNVSNEELAKIAYNDAQAIQDEADVMKDEVDVLRIKATEKLELSIAQKSFAQNSGISSDSSSSLISQSETNRIEGEELNKQADELVIIASSKESEAQAATKEANQLFNKSNTIGSIASNHPKKSEVSLTEKEAALKNKDAAESNQTVAPSVIVLSDDIMTVETSNACEDELPIRRLGTDEPISQVSEISSDIDKLDGTKKADSSVGNVANQDATKTALGSDENLVNQNNSVSKRSISVQDSVKIAKADSTLIANSSYFGNSTMDDSNLKSNLQVSDDGSKLADKTVTDAGNQNNILPNNNVAESIEGKTVVDTGYQNNILPNNNVTGNIEGKTVVDTGSQNNILPNNNVAESIEGKTVVDTGYQNNILNDNNISDNIEIRNVVDTSNQKNTLQTNNATSNLSDKTSVDTSGLNNTIDANTVISSSKSKIPVDGVDASKNQSETVSSFHSDSAFIKSDAMISKNAPMPVKEEAKIAYREYQSKMKHSNELTTQSLALQEEISRLPSSLERDSLIRESNSMSLESIQEWREALKKIQEARKIDPGVEYKMNVNDYASNIKKADKNSSMVIEAGLLKSSDSTVQANSVNSKSLSSLPASENKINYSEGSTDSSIKYSQDKNNSDSNLDTLHPDYPMYVKLKKDITDRQVTTIDVFAQAINLNKKSIEEKEYELALMDSAQAETDKDKKSDFVKRSFEQKTLSEKHGREAKELFALAQKHTLEVKGMKSELASIMDRITIHSDPNSLTASANLNSGNIKKGNTNNKLSPKLPLSDVKSNTAIKEKDINIGKQKPAFAMTSKMNDDLIAEEEDIASVDVTKNGLDEFVKNVFGNNESTIYSEKNPIPIDPLLPEGLIFKVQIGAFHKVLPSEIFKGIQPLTGETTRPGWVRYCAGLFKTFEPANIVKKEIQKIGYKDAFVVAYFNGKRIELNEAYRMLSEKQNLLAYKSESAKEIAMLRAINIHNDASGSINNDKDVNAFYGKSIVKGNSDINISKEFTIQVGVYRTANAPAAIASIKPLQTVPTNSNLYRFTTGRFSDYSTAESAKRLIVQSGIKDAFVVAYKNGVILNSEGLTEANKKTDLVSQTNKSTVLGKGINSEVENNQEGLIYKIQIGAYKNDVPYNMIESYLNIIENGISVKEDRGLHIFYVGNCKAFSDALALKAEIVSKGVKDAFIVALRDGKRIPISDEMKK